MLKYEYRSSCKDFEKRWLIEKDDLKFSYSKQLISILNNNGKDEIIEVPTIIIKKLLEYIEYLSCYDKLGRYGDFYYKLKQLIKNN